LKALALVVLVIGTGCHLTLGLEDKLFGEPTGAGASAGAGGDGGTSGGGTGGTGGMAQGGGGTGGACSRDCACDFGDTLDDEFPSGQSLEPLTGWDVAFHQEPGLQQGKQYGRFHLKLTALGETNFWAGEEDAPLVFRKVCGDFGVYTRVEVTNAKDPNAPPLGNHYGGGLLVRNAMSTPLDQEWLLYSIASDDMAALRTYVWSSSDSVNGQASVMPTDAAGSEREWILGMCRINGAFHFYRKLPGFSAEPLQVDLALEPQIPTNVPIQVGITAHRFEPDPTEEVGAYFDYVHYFRPDDTDECLARMEGAL
jgi:hypothetical protein